MENTIENKATFFAQYYNQKVYVNGHATGFLKRVVSGFYLDRINHFESDFLELKPLSLISDEEAIKVSEILSDSEISYPLDERQSAFHANTGRTHVLPVRPCRSDVADFLRSKGYGLPWMGLSVEKQLEYGWIKLIN